MMRNAPALARSISRIYARVDRQVEACGVRCKACGKCCAWGEEFVLFASSLEVRYLLGKKSTPEEVRPERCAYLQDGLCSARESRPLGCRTYFCERERRDELEEIHNRALRVLKRLAARRGLEWQYAPMMELLGERVRDLAGDSKSDSRGNRS